MNGKRLVILFCLAALAAVVFVLNKVAMTYYLYFFYWWYDIMMHFLGGVVIGGIAAWSAYRFAAPMSLRKFIFIALLSIAAVGIGWEVFEYLTGQYVGQQSIVLDTTLDLLMDTLGAIFASLLIRKILSPRMIPESPEPTQTL